MEEVEALLHIKTKSILKCNRLFNEKVLRNLVSFAPGFVLLAPLGLIEPLVLPGASKNLGKIKPPYCAVSGLAAASQKKHGGFKQDEE